MVAGDKLKEINEKVKQIISEQLGVDEAEVTRAYHSRTKETGAR